MKIIGRPGPGLESTVAACPECRTKFVVEPDDTYRIRQESIVQKHHNKYDDQGRELCTMLLQYAYYINCPVCGELVYIDSKRISTCDIYRFTGGRM